MISHLRQDVINLPYGRKTIALSKPPNLQDILTAREGTAISVKDALQNILQNPLGCPPLVQRFHRHDKIAIIIPDKTRRCPTLEILPPLLAELERGGAGPITLIIAYAAHSSHPGQELGLARNLGRKITISPSAAERKEDFVKIGSLPLFPFGLKKSIRIHKAAAQADLVIVIGSIFPHPMAGYSGGAKGIIPGVASSATIRLNHGLMFHRRSRWGVLKGNKCREDLEAGARLLPNVFLINAVYDGRKNVVGLVGGDLLAAHRAGVNRVREIGEVAAEKADIVIVSDGYPETMNVFQTLKLIVPASHVVKPGGIIICAGECPEGTGEMTFFHRLIHHLITKKNMPRGVTVYLFSEAKSPARLPHFIRPIPSLEEGIRLGLRKAGKNASLTVLPGASLLLPRTIEEQVIFKSPGVDNPASRF